jgi:hypothetical protein
MKAPVAILFLFVVAAVAQAPTLSPAQRAILSAREQIKRDPKQSQGYNDLAKALVRRGRESGDPDYYRQAARAVQDSLKIEADNFEGYKARVMVLLGEHEDAAALDLARKLNGV